MCCSTWHTCFPIFFFIHNHIRHFPFRLCKAQHFCSVRISLSWWERINIFGYGFGNNNHNNKSRCDDRIFFFLVISGLCTKYVTNEFLIIITVNKFYFINFICHICFHCAINHIWAYIFLVWRKIDRKLKLEKQWNMKHCYTPHITRTISTNTMNTIGAWTILFWHSIEMISARCHQLNMHRFR